MTTFLSAWARHSDLPFWERVRAIRTGYRQRRWWRKAQRNAKKAN